MTNEDRICNCCGKPFTRRTHEVMYIDYCDYCNSKQIAMAEGHPEFTDVANVSSTYIEKIKDKARFEVCEKIRDYIYSKEGGLSGIDSVLLLQELDQIERYDND